MLKYFWGVDLAILCSVTSTFRKIETQHTSEGSAKTQRSGPVLENEDERSPVLLSKVGA
jgi:hypothetical protein